MIIFLDIDGVLLPHRAYYLPNQTKPFVKTFDPCAVSLINMICEKTGAELVIHSSWLRTTLHGEESVKAHMVKQGIKEEYFHKDDSCKYRFSGTRWFAIEEWLLDHPEVSDYWIIDDEPLPYGYKDTFVDGRVITTDFDEGIQFKHVEMILANALKDS